MSDVNATRDMNPLIRQELKDGVLVATLDDKGAVFNTLTVALGEALGGLVARAANDVAVKAVVLKSGKPDSFIVGANIDMLAAAKTASDAERLATNGAALLRAIEQSPKPFVAAVHGQALGGGFEIALACKALVVSDDKKTVLGLPEVQLGLIPGAGGLVRLAKRAGLAVALDHGLTGKNLRASKAKKLGVADELCPAAVLDRVAIEIAQKLARGEALPPRKEKLQARATELFLEDTPMGRALLFKKAREATLKKTHGNYPAAERILDVLEAYAKHGEARAAELEARAFGTLVVSDTAHRLIEIFHAQTALKKDRGVDAKDIKALPVNHVTVLGGGLMGGGIAFVSAQAGLTVRIKERDDLGAGRGLKHVRGLLDERVKRRAMSREERDQVMARVTATTDFSGMSRTDLVVEAVFEDLALKHAIVRDVEAHAPTHAIFATNTSSIPIGRIAEASKRPERVVGMHYFSPVNKMPLLEVIRAAKTSDEVVATAVAVGKKQGKTVIVVKDGVGFYTSRILSPYMNEAAYLVSEGVPVDVIDEALVAWGFPVGPVALLDEVGIDVAAHVGPIMMEAFGKRLAPPATMLALVKDDRKGRKNRRGFYAYDEEPQPRRAFAFAQKKSSKKRVDETVYAALGVTPKASGGPTPEEIVDRCALQMVNEALHCFGEGLLRSPRDGDVGAIFGLGFPPFRGGPFRYLDAKGAKSVLARVRAFEDRFGERFRPAPLLVELGTSGKRIYG